MRHLTIFVTQFYPSIFVMTIYDIRSHLLYLRNLKFLVLLQTYLNENNVLTTIYLL